MHPEAREELSIRLKLTVLEYAKYVGVTDACGEFNIPRSTFYLWKQTYEHEGRAGLYRKKPIAYHHPRKTAPEVVEKILELRSTYQIGALRIAFYLDRYHGIKISESTVTRVLRAHGVNKLPKSAPKRALHSKRYAKTVPGHHVQVDVKFLCLKDKSGKVVKRYQYTAIDDATRIRALQIFSNHNQDCAIQFIDYVIEKFPFRISTVRTDLNCARISGHKDKRVQSDLWRQKAWQRRDDSIALSSSSRWSWRCCAASKPSRRSAASMISPSH